MTNIVLTKRETAILTEAAAHEDRLVVLPSSIKEGPATRLLTKFMGHALVVAREGEGGTTHHLTPAGFRALGLKAPRARRVPQPAGPQPGTSSLKPGTKRDLIICMLGREEGASLDELIVATGWLPHTTRAALSRLRSAGQALGKSTDDGRTVYRIMPEPAPKRLAGSLAEAAEAVTV